MRRDAQMENAILGLFLIVFIFMLIKNIGEWTHNNAQPQIPAQARAVSKRVLTHHHNHDGNTHIDHTYHVTFEYASGDRIEARVKHRDYKSIAEGDSGILTMQGTRFIGFERESNGADGRSSGDSSS